MCTRCLRNGLQCRYGFANRSGKPKGSKNRATLRKLGQLREEKSLVRGVRGGKPGASVADHEPLVTAGHPARKPEAILDDDVGICLVVATCAFLLIPRFPLGDIGMLDSRSQYLG